METQARPPSPQPVAAAKAAIQNSPCRRPQNQSLPLPNAAKNPYLNSYANAASTTTANHQEEGPQLRPCPRPAAQIAPDCLQKPLLQLRHAAKNPYLNSYANAAIETRISYEKSISSYDCGRIPICKRPPARPRTTLVQLRHKTTSPKVNSYENAASKTSPFKKEEARREEARHAPLKA